MKRVIILTGSELRHDYFRVALAATGDIDVVATYRESDEKGLKARTERAQGVTELMRRHVRAREQSESDHFGVALRLVQDHSNPVSVGVGRLSEADIQETIVSESPDCIVCYGTSLISGPILEAFHGRFVNVHLGLSPYYRGSGTNVWPLVDGRPECVGATFMHIDSGIDTGRIIHQIRASMYEDDTVHQVGNRLIAELPFVVADLITAFEQLADLEQPEMSGRLCKRSDWNGDAVERLYRNMEDGIIPGYLAEKRERDRECPILEQAILLRTSV